MRNLLIILLLLPVAFFGGAFLLPVDVHVERSVTINRPAATVFEILNSFRHFNEWSPWAELDPEAIFSWSGPEEGVGARLDWTGDPALIGTGWQEIVASNPIERVDTHIDLDLRAWLEPTLI